ncbi:Tripartite tricarboxylate transporter family receptor [Achromobacter xylosoxidans]|nr:Tripartite tricarboxylate transporter family receptor [Achromobacter xylosoxidans]
MSRRGFIHRALGTLAAAALAASAMPAWAGDFPDHPIRWLVPFSAGGGSDLATRIVAKHVSQALGQPVVVENRPGAATIVAAQETARAAPDGYTVMTAGMSTLALNPWLYKQLPYDPWKDLTPVSTLVALPIVLVASPASDLDNMPDVMDYLSRNKTASYASLGVGSPHHLAMELFLSMFGAKATAIPYKGTPPALQDVAAGVVPLMMADLAAARPLIEAGKLRAIAVPGRRLARGGGPGAHAARGGGQAQRRDPGGVEVTRGGQAAQVARHGAHGQLVQRIL